MYENILVAIDPHTPANVDQAISVAQSLRNPQGQITLVTVLADIPPYAAEHVPVGQLELNKRAAEVKLEEYTNNDANIQTLVTVDSASAGAALVGLATEKVADLIIIASHRPGLQDYFLGSTAGRVVRHSPCAVHVLR